MSELSQEEVSRGKCAVCVCVCACVRVRVRVRVLRLPPSALPVVAAVAVSFAAEVLRDPRQYPVPLPCSIPDIPSRFIPALHAVYLSRSPRWTQTRDLLSNEVHVSATLPYVLSPGEILFPSFPLFP